MGFGLDSGGEKRKVHVEFWRGISLKNDDLQDR
jgi:hypothetical protein